MDESLLALSSDPMQIPLITSRREGGALVPLLLGALLLTGVGAPTPAAAALYKYRKADGSVLLTNQRRPDLELVEVVSQEDDSSPKPRRAPQPSHSEEEADDHSHTDRKADDADAAPSNVGPLRRARFDDLIREASEAYDVPFAFIKAVIRVESDFTPDAVSHAGAMGLMQLMPATADELNVTEPFDPRQNVFGGTKLLRRLIDRYDGDINLILSAYNAGGGAVAEYGGIPYSKTRRYVASVYRWYRHYSGDESGGRE